MKFLGVIFLGLMAAACMAGLMVFLPPYFRGPIAAQNELPPEVQVVIAAKPIPSMKIVEADSVVTKRVRRPDTPEHSLSDPVQVVGKVLLVPMTVGQAFNKNYFASEGSGLHLASVLPNGMRAVGISLNDYSGLEGLLYPGCKVDVLTSFKSASGKEGISRTLLQNIQVLGIEDATIVSAEGSRKPGSLDRSRKRMVSVMVDMEQAKILQAAMQEATISLAMRNPLDSMTASTAQVERPFSFEPAKPPPAKPKTKPKSKSAQTKPAEEPTWDVNVYRQGKMTETLKFKQPNGSK